MVDDRTRRDDELLRALGDLGRDHDPDVASILRRVDLGAAHHPRRTTPTGPPLAAVLLPAASVLLVILGVVLVTHSGNDGVIDSGSTSARIAAERTPPTHPTTGGAPAGAGATAGPHASTDPGHGGPSSGSQPGGAPAGSSPTASGGRTALGHALATSAAPDPNAIPAFVDVKRMTATGTHDVVLSTPALLDWMVFGTRSDLAPVRARHPAAQGVLTVDQPAWARRTGGPFHRLWRDGRPDLEAGSWQWVEIAGPRGVSLTVAASSQPRSVVVYSGNQDISGLLTIDGPGVASTQTSLGGLSYAMHGLVVTIVLPPTTGDTHIRLTAKPGATVGADASYFLAAVTVATSKWTPRATP